MNSSFAWILRALLSHYRRHPWQTLFQAVGLLAGVGLWSAVQIVNHHAENSYREAQSLLGAQASYWVQSRRDDGIEQARYVELRRAGFRQVFPLVELDVSTADGISIDVIGTDLLALPGSDPGGPGGEAGFAEDWLAFIRPPYSAWYPEALAAELGIRAGERLTLRDGRQLPPARLGSREQQGRRVLVDIGAALELAGDDRFDLLAVGSIDPDAYRRLEALLPPELELVENQQHIDLRELTESLHSHLTAMSLLSFAVGLFIVFNAVRFSLWYRRATLHDLRLMGCTAQQLLAAIVLETLLWSLLGALLGFALGILVAHALLPGLGASLQSLYDATVDAELGLSTITLLQAWSITLLGLAWALAWPLYRQLRLSSLRAGSSLEILRDEHAVRWRLAIAAVLLALVAWVTYQHVETVNQGFVVLGLMLFAAAWLLPLLLAAGLRLVSALLPGQGLMMRWVLCDGLAQLPAFRSAMMALLLALTANLGVGTLVDSFRDAFVGWLEVRQSADIYVRAPRIDYPALEPSTENAAWLVDSHRRIGVTTRWGGRPTLLRGIDPLAPDSLELPLSRWQGESPDEARRIWREQPGKVLINEQVHFLAGVEVGEQVELETDGGARKYEVVGVFYDYGNPYFQFYLPTGELERNWRHYYSRGIALWLNVENEAAMQRAETVLRGLGAQPGDWISQAEVRRLSLGIFDRTFAITAAMNGLTMLVAAIALLASLLAILQERLPEFAQWRALGLRQSEQLLLVVIPLLIFSAIAWLMAIPLGALLSWVLIYKVNIVSFGWSMPLVWKFAPAAQLAAVVLGVCTMTLLLVAWQWRRRMPEALARLGETV